MLDRRFIRENSDAVRVAVRVKGINLDVDELLSLDQASRELQRELDEVQTRRKRFSRECLTATPWLRSTCPGCMRQSPGGGPTSGRRLHAAIAGTTTRDLGTANRQAVLRPVMRDTRPPTDPRHTRA
jgi:Seryl-tRNA synthetase N-terminal domain